MRIISGIHKGILIKPPAGLPVRPTTDKAKESLFNILNNNLELESIHVLDLFAGTGNMSFEFCSRGAAEVVAVDINQKCVEFIRSTAQRLNMPMLRVVKKDAFSFLKTNAETFDLIFADAPYANQKVIDIPKLVFGNNALKDGGWLIVEHEAHLDLSHESGYFDKRIYGQSAFSFFKHA